MSRVPVEWEGASWVMGNRETFKDYAGSDALPRWLRVTYAAYAHVGANGHAVFRQTELAVLLGETIANKHIPTERQRVREAIDGAIERGLLEPGSKALCLIVPRAAVTFGQGDAAAPCRRHRRNQRNDETVSPENQTTRSKQVVSTSKERGNRVVSRSAPLSLLTTNGDSPRERPA